MDGATVLAQAAGIKDQIILWRRRVHQWPELGFEEERTAALAAEALAQMGCRVRTGVGRTGVVGEIGSGSPVVALRADMDALPIQEETGLAFASQRPGLMHACGHDAHVAMLLGAATILCAAKPAGTVRILFQPSEEASDGEGYSGAARMVADGAMAGVDSVFGLHAIPEL
ncbi:MAG: M20 metallopeptidase family protein, partial [Anaerolineae bacterium]